MAIPVPSAMRQDLSDLIQLLKSHALKHGEFTLASGERSSYYLDCRLLTLSAHGAALIGRCVLTAIRDYSVDAIGGLTLGADPIVGAVLALSGPVRRNPLAGFLVRKEPKTHGMGNLIEGPLEDESSVALVEDVCSSGRSVLRAVEAVRHRGCRVSVIVSVVDRGQGARDLFEGLDIPYISLTRFHEGEFQPGC